MRTQPITLSHLAVVHLIHTLQLPHQWLLPMITAEENTVQSFITARTEWESGNLVEQDFDGSLSPQPYFARLLYNITHARGAMRFETESDITLYLRGPVDLLCLVQSKESLIWSLHLCPASDIAHFVNTILLSAVSGTLSTEGIYNGEIKMLRSDFSTEEVSDPSSLLTEHLLLFFERYQPAPLNGG